MTDESVFAAALAIPNATERAAYLDRACAKNPALRREVDELLAAHGDPNALDRPPGDLARTGAFDPAATAAPPMAVAGDRIGHYKLLERIGEGGMGEVWFADQLEPIKRRVALKLVKPGMDTKSVLARFEAERQALAVMDHPNIAKVLDAGTTPDGRPYFVMELVKGTPITEFCDARKLTPKERLELFVPVCQAIQHAHMKGIIHRDIKPSNVLVALHDETPVAKVIDFGVAKAIGHQLTDKTLFTGFGTLVGTPAYMAPEQASFNQLDVDTRADVYALGVLLYELLAGSPPIERDRLKLAALDEVLRIVRDEEPPRPSQRLSTSQAKASIAATRQSDPGKLSQLMKGELDWIVMKALEKDRTRRYDTANGLAKDVQRYLAGDSVEACPPTLAYRLRKSYRRNKAAVWLTVIFTSLVTSSAAIAIGLAYAAHQAEARATADRKRAEDGEADAREQQARAEAEQKRAEEEKRAAEAVRSFLQDDLLRQASVKTQAQSLPLVGGEFEIKPNPTINELLDRAAAQLTPNNIEAKFPNLPFVQAEVLHAVASAYSGIAQDVKSLALIDRAIPLYLAVRGPDDRATLNARHLQAMQYQYLGHVERSEKALAAVVADIHRVFGPRDRIAFDAQVWIGRSMTLNGRAAGAIPYLRKLKADGTEFFGPTDTLTLIAAGHLAMAYRMNRQLPEALREMEALRESTRHLKIRPDHPMLDAAFGELAEAYKAMNRPEKAKEVWREIISSWEQRGEPHHRSTWVARHESGWLQSGQGDTEGAAKLFEANVLAADTPVKKMMSYLALQQMEQKLGRHDAALEHARQALAVLLAGQPPTFRSWNTGQSRLRIGQLLVDRKQYAEAEPLLVDALRDLLEFDAQKPEWDRGLTAKAQRALVNLYKATNRPAEASRAADAYWTALENQGKDAATWGGRNSRAWEAFNEGDHESAAKLFEMNVKVATTPEDKSRSYHGLQESELKLGRPDAALDHAREAVEVIVAARGPNHRSYLLGCARSGLGSLLLAQKSAAEAEPHLVAGCREVADHADQIPTYDYLHRHIPFNNLIRLLEETNRRDEAKKWLAVKAELMEKLLRKTLLGGKLTSTTVTLTTQLVMDHVSAGRHDEALALYRELDSKYKPADRSTDSAWLALSANVLNIYESKLQPERVKSWAALRLPAMERDYRAALEGKKTEIQILVAAQLLVYTYVDAGRNADAIKLFDEIHARQKANGWGSDATSTFNYSFLATAATLAGRPDLAQEMCVAVLADLEKKPGTAKVEIARLTFALGRSRVAAGAHAEAESLFRTALKLQTEANAKSWMASKYKAWVGFTLCDQKKYDAAEPLLRDAHAEFAIRLAAAPMWEKQHPHLIAERLASLYAATNQPEKAAEWKATRNKK